MASNIHTICKKISRITDAEIAGVEKIAQQQMNYIHPLKMASATKVHNTGVKNLECLKKLRELRDLLKS